MKRLRYRGMHTLWNPNKFTLGELLKYDLEAIGEYKETCGQMRYLNHMLDLAMNKANKSYRRNKTKGKNNGSHS